MSKISNTAAYPNATPLIGDYCFTINTPAPFEY
ncbi:unnamed protein product, partial [marine sediment metagenome]